MPPWILHLSDPHLGDVSPGQALDDEVVKIASQPDIETTQRVFKRTLANLKWFVKEHGRPTVVVVSGDITYQAGQKGFEAFVELLSKHADVLPDHRSRIVVTPGNHDVRWDASPGTTARYVAFLAATRYQQCTTPLLDGVDFASDDEDGHLLDGALDHPHVVQTDGLLVVPLNTSNYCGALVDVRRSWTEDEWKDALAPLGEGREEAVRQLKGLYQHDIARVSRGQIEALAHLFEAQGLQRHRSSDDHLRVAVLHHQLLPVSTREQRKPFESLVNLGLVRQTLCEYGFDLVLHGHKHESGVYWDIVASRHDRLDAPARRMLVISSPGHFAADMPAMRAIFLQGTPNARNLRVVTLRASATRKRPVIDSDELAPVWLSGMDTESPERTTIRAQGAHTAYARLRAAFEVHKHRAMTNLVCHVDHPDDARSLPPDYPEVGFAEPQQWFEELVAWWQLDRSELVERGITLFNHGERISRRWGDQVARAIHLLDQRANSSRALVELVDPKETGRYECDYRNLTVGAYPAFVLAQFTITEREGRHELDCFAYFRKQEIQFWWPVNLAEIAMLQEKVRSGLRCSLNTGRIVTFSAIALWNDTLPRVAVPEVDRLVEDSDRRWALAAAVAFPRTATEDTAAEWQRLLTDLEGPGRDAPPVAKAGVEALLDEVERFAQLPDTAPLDGVKSALSRLHTQYAAIDGDPNEAAARLIRSQVARLREAIKSAVGAP